MSNIMTPRQSYWNDLLCIADINGELYRRMSFSEAQDWLYAYENMVDEGYDKESAAERAWDCFFAPRIHRSRLEVY